MKLRCLSHWAWAVSVRLQGGSCGDVPGVNLVAFSERFGVVWREDDSRMTWRAWVANGAGCQRQTEGGNVKADGAQVAMSLFTQGLEEALSEGVRGTVGE